MPVYHSGKTLTKTQKPSPSGWGEGGILEGVEDLENDVVLLLYVEQGEEVVLL